MTFQGKLSAVTKGLQDPKEIIGKPITLDETGEIGKIIEIDAEKDIFFGKIDNSQIGDCLISNIIRFFN